MTPTTYAYQPTGADLAQAVTDLAAAGLKPYDISVALGIGLGAVTSLLGTLPMRASP